MRPSWQWQRLAGCWAVRQSRWEWRRKRRGWIGAKLSEDKARKIKKADASRLFYQAENSAYFFAGSAAGAAGAAAAAGAGAAAAADAASAAGAAAAGAAAGAAGAAASCLPQAERARANR